MEEHSLQLKYQSCALGELAQADRQLIERAREASERSYAPYSHFQVGCALLLENGETVTGCNQENASYPCGTCAERTALNHALSEHPDLKVLTLAIAAQQDGAFTASPLPPCGLCRQALTEAEERMKAPIRLLLYGTSKVLVIPAAGELLPFQFDASMMGSSFAQ